MIGFLIILLLGYLFYWMPYISEQNKNINRTIQMLNMIPVKVMKEIIGVRQIITELVYDMKKHSDLVRF